MAFAGGFLFWSVLTKNLPHALASSEPELALRLNPDNPAALLSLAENIRQNLLELIQPEEQTATLSDGGETVLNDGQELSPALSADNQTAEEESPEIRALRKRIRNLVMRAIANDPLNARAFRLLAEVSEPRDETRRLMLAAFERSRRVPIAVLWLLDDSFQRQDYVDVIKKADILMRNQPQFAPDVMAYLGLLAATTEGQPALIAVLKKQPVWRDQFFRAIPNNVRLAGTPFELMLELKKAESPPSSDELAPYLHTLIQSGLVQYAYEVWTQLRADERAAPRPLLNNADFAEDPSDIPFDWSVRRGKNATFEFLPSADQKNGRVIRFDFGIGRTQFPELSQMIVLTPGRYRLEGEFRGMIRGKRGLRWQVRCWQGKDIAETEMLYGASTNSWRGFGLIIEIPDRDDCRSQQLRIFHDSRSASEDVISGHISFRHINLKSIETGGRRQTLNQVDF